MELRQHHKGIGMEEVVVMAAAVVIAGAMMAVAVKKFT